MTMQAGGNKEDSASVSRGGGGGGIGSSNSNHPDTTSNSNHPHVASPKRLNNLGGHSPRHPRWRNRFVILGALGCFLLMFLWKEVATLRVYSGYAAKTDASTDVDTPRTMKALQHHSNDDGAVSVESREAIVVKKDETRTQESVSQGAWSIIAAAAATMGPRHNVTSLSTTAQQSSSLQHNQKKEIKIALYMTTHLSEQHLGFIRKCWPFAVTQLPLLQQADLLVYTSAPKEQDTIFHTLGFRNVTVYHYQEALNPEGARQAILQKNNDLDTQKQDGAIRALVDPFLPSNQWFASYDWVIRVNPDVLIRRDTWLLETMHNDSVAGIFVPWQSPWHGFCFHTDFFAFRPTAADGSALVRSYWAQKATGRLHAETHFFKGFTELYKANDPKRQFVWLPGVNKTAANGVGHVSGKDCDVLHVHPLVDFCPNYFNVSDPEGIIYRR